MPRSTDFAGRFDLVRAANILNKSYFSTAQIRSAVSNIRSYLSGAGSLLIVTGRTRRVKTGVRFSK